MYDPETYSQYECDLKKPCFRLLENERFTVLLDKLILGRHGKTSYNTAGLLQGSSDIPLSEEGREEMSKEAQTLLSEPRTITQIVSSDMKRACETATIFSTVLGGNICHTVTPLLREYGSGDWEGMKITDLIKTEPYHNKWTKKPITYSLVGVPNNGEPFLTFLNRVNEGLYLLEKLSQNNHHGEKIFVISHATVNRAIRYLSIISAQNQGGEVSLSTLQKYEQEFFFDRNGSFIKVTHGKLRIDAEKNLVTL